MIPRRLLVLPKLTRRFFPRLQSQNWVLFYALISRHLTDLFPIIYVSSNLLCSRPSSAHLSLPSFMLEDLTCVGSLVSALLQTPTEADAIASYSHVFRRPQGGIFLSYPRRETLEQDFKTHLLDAKGNKRKIDLVVVSDGEAILVRFFLL